jgi:hypothetical protein
MAVDDRIKVAAPVNMVSFISQGGGCQEAANVRVDANNVMFAAMMAPRPLLMISASGDWTHNTPVEEYPAVRSIYRLLGAEQNVEQLQIDAPHNYNQQSREAVYTFFGARLLGTKGPVKEEKYRAEMPQNLLAMFGRQRPANAITSIEQYVNDRIAEAKRSVEELKPRDRETLEKARSAFSERLTFSMLDQLPSSSEVISEKRETTGQNESLLLGRNGKGDRVPAVWLAPSHANPEFPPSLIIHPEGLAWAVKSSQTSGGLVKRILDSGGAVLAIDPFQTGSAKASREHAQRSFTVYNQTEDTARVQDILTALQYLHSRTSTKTVNLVGLEMGGVWAWFARSLAGPGVNLAADLAHFQADNDQEYLDRFFIPGLRKAGDFRAAALLDTTGKLLVSNAGPGFPADWVRESAKIAGTRADIRNGEIPDPEFVRWLGPQ